MGRKQTYEIVFEITLKCIFGFGIRRLRRPEVLAEYIQNSPINYSNVHIKFAVEWWLTSQSILRSICTWLEMFEYRANCINTSDHRMQIDKMRMPSQNPLENWDDMVVEHLYQNLVSSPHQQFQPNNTLTPREPTKIHTYQSVTTSTMRCRPRLGSPPRF